MERNPKVVIIYRIAEKQNKNVNKVKPDWITNANCLENIKKARSATSELVVFGDKLDESLPLVEEGVDKFIPTTAHGNAETFLEVLSYAIENYGPEDIVYFVEDDYVHRPGFDQIIQEGLARADYVSLYDHPDKYGRETSHMFVTESTHWKFTTSTTMTFAARVKTLSFDEQVFKSFITTGNPPDHHIFLTLTQELQRKLATPIPGWATHGETQWLAPIIKWEGYI